MADVCRMKELLLNARAVKKHRVHVERGEGYQYCYFLRNSSKTEVVLLKVSTVKCSYGSDLATDFEHSTRRTLFDHPPRRLQLHHLTPRLDRLDLGESLDRGLELDLCRLSLPKL